MCKIVEILMLRVLNSVSIEIIFKLSIETEHLMPTAALHVTRVHVSPAMSPQRVPGRPVEASTRCSLGPSQLDSLHEAQLVETEEVAGKYPRHSGKGNSCRT